MKKLDKINLEDGLKKEWILTNRTWWIRYVNGSWM